MSARTITFLIAASVAISATSGDLQAQTLIPVIESGPRSERINLVVLSEAYTASELATKFPDDGAAFVEAFLSRQPFAAFRGRFNAYLIAVASNESGADDPSEGISRDTYFNATFDTAGIARLLTINSTGRSRVNSLLASLLPEYDIPLVLVNDDQYGGAGGTPPVASTNSASSEIAIHEIGHSFGGLADEYTSDSASYTPSESANATAVTDRELVGWKHWIEAGTPVPTPDTSAWGGKVGLFEGANYRSSGWYRPTRNSLMRSLSRPFEAVNEERLVLRMYDRLPPVAGSDPPAGAVEISSAGAVSFRLDLPPLPEASDTGVSWYLDGRAVSGDSRELDLVRAGSRWRYLDTGVAPPAGWAAVGFDDAGWSEGPAQLGYGDGDENTLISPGPNPSSRAITTWFRHRFTVANPADISALQMELLRDDGAVVYLNGVEVYRDGMASGAVSPSTLAANGASGSDEDRFFDAQIDPLALVAGENVLAVELHQSSTSSSDISFDLELRGLLVTEDDGALLAFGSEWRYDDSGSEPPSEWSSVDFDDSSWEQGAAELGFGDGDEVTVISEGAISYRFRQRFELATLEGSDRVEGFLRRDDAAVVYLNGVEVFRSNLPDGALSHTTPAAQTTPDDGEEIHGFTIPPGLLEAGENVIAVQVHQRSASSSDVSFDLELVRSGAVDFVLDPVALGDGDYVLEARVSDPTGKVRQDPDNLAREVLRWDLTISLPDLDTDGDGMDDAWEREAFGTLDEMADGDADADGCSNLNEFMAGTDPVDAGSRFEILGLQVGDSPSEITLSWTSVPGRRYRIMRSPDLSAGSWSLVARALAEVPPAAQTERTFATGAESGRQFYRIEIAP